MPQLVSTPERLIGPGWGRVAIKALPKVAQPKQRYFGRPARLAPATRRDLLFSKPDLAADRKGRQLNSRDPKREEDQDNQRGASARSGGCLRQRIVTPDGGTSVAGFNAVIAEGDGSAAPEP